MCFDRCDFNTNLRTVEQAKTQLCPFPGVTQDGKCAADGCMAWHLRSDGTQRTETTNIVRNGDGSEGVSGEPPRPDGDGWEKDGMPSTKGYHRSAKDGLPPGLAQKWVRLVSAPLGSCGRLGGGPF